MLLKRNCIRSVGSLGLLASLAIMAFPADQTKAVNGKLDSDKMALVKKGMETFARKFEENAGQWSSDARFIARGRGVDLWLTEKGVRFDHYKSVAGKDSLRKGQVVQMSFVGGKSMKFVGVSPDDVRTDYVRGNGVIGRSGRFAEVMGLGLYSGVDLRAYTENGSNRYDLIVAPNANPSNITMKFAGANSIKASGGTITVGTQLGPVQHTNLFAYQTIGGKKKQVAASFKQVGADEVKIELGKYDASKALVIDPVVYGSYYGGDNGYDEVRALTTDGAGSVYLTGTTQASQFPATIGPYSMNVQAQDAYVTKFDGANYRHVYAAFLGGSANDTGQGIQVDSLGNVWIAGTTQSADFPGNTKGAGTNIFITLFRKSDTKILDPLPTSTIMLGGNGTETIGGFAVLPAINPLLANPVVIGIAGDTNAAFPVGEVPNGTFSSAKKSYMIKVAYEVSTQVFTVDATASQYVGAQNAIATADLRGFQFDRDGNMYVAGQVRPSNPQNSYGQVDTSVNPGVWITTPNSYPGGRLLKETDIYVRKYSPNGTMLFSTLLGGDNDDSAGGVDRDVTGATYNSGSTLAVDVSQSVYVTGIARSFNFASVLGINSSFDNNAHVFAVKISADFTRVLYAKNLGTDGNVRPSGIAVDSQGNAYVGGTAEYATRFPQPPGDPNEPSGVTAPTIRLINPLDADYSVPDLPQIPTTEGWLNQLDAAGNIVFGTWIGGKLDEHLWGPYVEQNTGDVWAFGSTDSFRTYTRTASAAGSAPMLRQYPAAGLEPLPAVFITTNAFKSSPDAAGLTRTNGALYGLLESPFTGPAVLPGGSDNGIRYQKDGFIIKIRNNAPLLSSLTLNPTTLPGGLGVFTTATLTLSATTASDANITVSLDSTQAASFDPVTDLISTVVVVPAGQTTVTVPIYTKGVNNTTPVQVLGNYQGSFQVANFTVIPWLQEFTLQPALTVGGNQISGRITLSRPAPAGGAPIDVSTDTPSLLSFPSATNNQILVPAGQTSFTFPINTNGVAVNTFPQVSASLLGVTKTQAATLQPASLSNLTFAPARTAGNTQVVGTLTLNGQTGSPGFTVNLTMPAAAITKGYRFVGAGGALTSTLAVDFASGDTSKTFSVQTVYESISANTVVTATRPPVAGTSYQNSVVSGNFWVDPYVLAQPGIVANPSTIDGGATSDVTITITTPAPSSGVPVLLSTNNASVLSFPAGANVTIPSGATSVTVKVLGAVLANTTTANVSVTLGPTTRSTPITVRGVVYGLSVNPASLVGGTGNSTGTITLAAPAPAGGLSFTITSSDASAVVPSTPVVVPAGSTTATFTITTKSVSTVKNVTISAILGSATQTAILVIRPVSAISVVFNPATVRGGNGVTPMMTVTLDAPAIVDTDITLTYSNSTVFKIPRSLITVLKGSTSASVPMSTRFVSRNIACTVTASTGGGGASGTLIVTR